MSPAAGEIPLEEIPPDEAAFWGKQLKGFVDSTREVRAWWPEFSDELALRAGAPAARVVRRYMPSAEERPELVLAVILVPWILAVIQSELAHYQQTRRPAAERAPGSERGHLRPEGIRQDLPGTEVIGSPLFPAGVDR